MVKNFVIFCDDEEYFNSFVFYYRLKKYVNYNFNIFTNDEDMYKFLDENDAYIFVSEREGLNLGKHNFVISDKYFEEDNYICKYQKIDEIIEKILFKCNEKIYVNKQNNLVIDGIFSYGFPMLKERFINVYKERISFKDLLIINTDKNLQIEARLSLSEILYYASQNKDKAYMKIMNLDGNIIGNLELMEDIYDIKLWRNLFEIISSVERFSRVLIILPETIIGLNNLLSMLNSIYYPSIDGFLELDNMFINNWEANAPEISEKIERYNFKEVTDIGYECRH